MSETKLEVKVEVPKVLTPEEESKLRRQRLDAYDRAVRNMSHRQLRGELRRTIKSDTTKEGYKPGLKISLATVLLAVLENTKTAPVFEWNEKGKPTRIARKDQINPNPRAGYMNPGV